MKGGNIMKVNLKQFVYSFGIIGIMLLTSNLYAQTPGDHSTGRETMREKMKARMLEVFKQLNLNHEQEKQLKVQRNKHREQTEEIRKSLKTKREEIRNELQKQELNMEKINKTHSELKDLRSKTADLRLEGILEVRKILTTEQFKKFCELKKDIHPMKKKREGFY
jgi:Spy/CpxP family protein refolding chaperone